MSRFVLLLLLLWVILITTDRASGQNNRIEHSRPIDSSSLNNERGESEFQPSGNQRSDQIPVDVSIQDEITDSFQIDAPALTDDLSRFQSFDRTRPGSKIGSDFFGLDDNFDDGLLIVSGDVAMKIGGFLKVDFIQDFNPIGSTDSFDVTTIEVGVPPRTNTRFHARQSRLNVDTRWNSEQGPIRVFIEGDFFFNQRENFELGENRFRLRHAYAQHGHWIIGQYWTTLSDVAASPATLDFEGQVASVSTRRTQIRWTHDIGASDWSIALALEDPFTIIEAPDGVTGEPRTQTPDAVIRMRWSRPKTQFQVAGVARQLGFQPTGEPVIETSTWGLNFTQVSQLSDQTKFYFEVLFGSGIGSFKGVPDIARNASGETEVVGLLGWMVGGTHDWTDRWSSNITFAQDRAININDPIPDQLFNITYLASNLICQPTKNTNFGVEYLYGLRENFDGQSAQANRIQVAFTYFLP